MIYVIEHRIEALQKYKIETAFLSLEKTEDYLRNECCAEPDRTAKYWTSTVEPTYHWRVTKVENADA